MSIPSPLKQYCFQAILIWWHSLFKGKHVADGKAELADRKKQLQWTRDYALFLAGLNRRNYF
jgi:hypothetical protein